MKGKNEMNWPLFLGCVILVVVKSKLCTKQLMTKKQRGLLFHGASQRWERYNNCKSIHDVGKYLLLMAWRHTTFTHKKCCFGSGNLELGVQNPGRKPSASSSNFHDFYLISDFYFFHINICCIRHGKVCKLGMISMVECTVHPVEYPSFSFPLDEVVKLSAHLSFLQGWGPQVLIADGL